MGVMGALGKEEKDDIDGALSQYVFEFWDLHANNTFTSQDRRDTESTTLGTSLPF